MIMFILSYLLGKKANKNYLEMAKLTRDQYKKDNEEIIRQQELKKLRDNTAKRKANKARKSLEDEKARRIKDLENKTSNIDDVFEGIGIDKK
jgi:NAD-dependent SIR2 family protein deacetylase